MIPGKGHDVLLDALATIADLSWHCVCVGSLDRDPAFADGLRRRALDGGLGDRVRFPGPRTGADLDRSYAAADLLVLPSRAETYGMVVTEALARGLPVVAAEVGGVDRRPSVTAPTGSGRGCSSRPTTLRRSPPRCGPGSPTPSCDERSRRAARERRASLSGWSTTTSVRRGRPGRSGAMTVEGIRVSRGWLDLREPADAAARAPRPRRARSGDVFRRPVAR